MFEFLFLRIVDVFDLILLAYFWIIIARAVLSWVNPDPFNPVVRFLYRATEPVLRPIRHRLPTLAMGLDLSPLVVLLAISVLQRYLLGWLRDLAFSLR
ncbi:MAG TPA: YggT family protein [Methylomirabilota bacterium]|nr:YggT family protein [Methylomirabilota bacterium]